jgi:hypothetical protein
MSGRSPEPRPIRRRPSREASEKPRRDREDTQRCGVGRARNRVAVHHGFLGRHASKCYSENEFRPEEEHQREEPYDERSPRPVMTDGLAIVRQAGHRGNQDRAEYPAHYAETGKDERLPGIQS